MARPITERIATAFKPDARITDVEALIADIEKEIAEASVEKHRLESVATSAKSTDAQADQASDDAIKLGRTIVRREGQLKDLQARLEQLRNSERQKQLRIQYDAAQAENDQLTVDLTEQWPQLSAAMVDLLNRIIRNDMAIETVNLARPSGCSALTSAEVRARNCPAHFRLVNGTPLARLLQCKIVGLDDAPNPAWPIPQHLRGPRTADLHEYMSRIGNT